MSFAPAKTNPDHRIHATSIIAGLGMTYGTSLFVSDPKCVHTDEFQIPALLVPDADTLLLFKEKLPTLERCKKEIKYTEYKHFALVVEYFDLLGLKPNENLYNIVKNENNISQENIRKLFLKETKYLGVFKLIGKNITYITHNIKLNKEDFHLLKGVDEIDEFLSKYDSKLMKSTDWGATTNIEYEGGFINLKIKLVVISKKLKKVESYPFDHGIR